MKKAKKNKGKGMARLERLKHPTRCLEGSGLI
jgi:hypothetical protein